MKRFTKALAALMLTVAVVVAAGCTKPEDPINPNNGGNGGNGGNDVVDTIFFTVSVSANPTDGGTVSGGGTYQQGQSCTLTATANSDYTFINWTENGNQVSTDANYTFTVTDNRTLVAQFDFNVVDIHESVDLGLPSGLLWATCNLGADTPEGYGDYYAWAEIEPKDVYNWSTYRYSMGAETKLTKYCNVASYGYYGYTDSLSVLEASDDVATVQWGNNWRMPSEADWEELVNNTTNTWTTLNGVNGQLLTASNGNSIFLPATGFRHEDGLHATGLFGFYWSSSLYTTPSNALFVTVSSVSCLISGASRYGGSSVRAVRSVR